MSMYFGQRDADSIDLVDEVVGFMLDAHGIDVDEKAWQLARQSYKAPVFANVYATVALDFLKKYIEEKVPSAEVSFHVDALNTRFLVNGEEYNELEDVMDFIQLAEC